VVSGNPPSTVVGGSMTWEVIWAGIINEQQSLFSGVFFFVDCGLRLTEEVGAGQEVVFTISGQLLKFYRRDNSYFFFCF